MFLKQEENLMSARISDSNYAGSEAAPPWDELKKEFDYVKACLA